MNEKHIIRDFINHVCATHREEFPHERTIDLSNPSPTAERYFWLRGFLIHCEEAYKPAEPTVKWAEIEVLTKKLETEMPA